MVLLYAVILTSSGNLLLPCYDSLVSFSPWPFHKRDIMRDLCEIGQHLCPQEGWLILISDFLADEAW